MRSKDSISSLKPGVKRQSTGKRLRFEVFKRDGFTCRYCGAQPPDVVLVIDHVLPIAEGGANDADNLVTACEPCNQGKAHRNLGSLLPRIDADERYLEVQQEVAEMRRYQESLLQREEALLQLVQTFQQLWADTSGLDWYPKDRVFRGLLTKYDPEIVEEATVDVGTKIGTGYLREKSNWTSYMWAVARNIALERGVPG